MASRWPVRQAICVLAVLAATPPAAWGADTAAFVHQDLQAVASRIQELFHFVDLIKVESVVGQGQLVVNGINEVAALLVAATAHVKGQDPVAESAAQGFSSQLMSALLSPVRTLLRGMEKTRFPLSQDSSCNALKLIETAVGAMGTALDEYEAALLEVIPTEAGRVNMVKQTLGNSVREFLLNWHADSQQAAKIGILLCQKD
ncbi:hypothetical protein KFL_000140420 [Klebsormidium nitens]|uniref:Uncharacterized protein n=1 Tax=Klebsormidium nitens TaxID=105231 RepID=A0A1Y1HLI8_KLENI|nr:hypothetical protein KFL_000140420 [Klebsormidium nitens]|eukprot:GAQ78522.1 hypothetical protein KFL_000140420 [Klebsormidium nitens]